MPAIASLEDLKVTQRDGRSKFLIVTPYALPVRRSLLPSVALAKEGGVGRRFTLCALLHAVGSQIESNRMSFKR